MIRSRRRGLSRRQFLGSTTAVVSSFSLVSSSVLGLRGQTSPNNKLNIACIGVGGQGASDVNGVSSENLVALCDVDSQHAARTLQKYPAAKRFQDYRKMLDELDKQVDAVVVATPDHTHAAAVLRAIGAGKHVYCEKPLAHSIHEVRAIMAAAKKHKVMTQLGNQGHSFDSIREFCEWTWDGAIGTVREVHAMCASVYSRIDQLARLKEAHPVPSTLDWDLWLGPVQERPFHPMYLPGKWRGWSAFGTGVIGDWTCHVVDPVFWALDLGSPTTIEAEGEWDPAQHAETFPWSAVVRYEFPARGDRAPVKLVWYDGEKRPPTPEELEPGKKMPGIGALVVGDKGKILYGSHGAGGVRLLPEAKMREYKKPAQKLERSPGHHREWIAACKGGKAPGSNFEYGGPLTEIALLGIIALRMKGQKLQWDGAQMRFTNSDEANRLLKPEFRGGWGL